MKKKNNNSNLKTDNQLIFFNLKDKQEFFFMYTIVVNEEIYGAK
jgi:hypothetical protein